jgi:hypothetical protein
MGRVMGLVTAGAMVAQPVGLLLGGALIAALGFTGFTVLMASLTCVVALAIAISPALRGLDDAQLVGR